MSIVKKKKNNLFECKKCKLLRCKYHFVINSDTYTCFFCHESEPRFAMYPQCILCTGKAKFGSMDKPKVEFCHNHAPRNVHVYAYDMWCTISCCVATAIFLNPKTGLRYCEGHSLVYNQIDELKRYSIDISRYVYLV